MARIFASVAGGFVFAAMWFSAPAGAQSGPPLNGEPVSSGLGPTYGEEWCEPVGSENLPQADPLALIPYAAIRCTLDQFEDEALAAGVPDRLSYTSSVSPSSDATSSASSSTPWRPPSSSRTTPAGSSCTSS